MSRLSHAPTSALLTIEAELATCLCLIQKASSTINATLGYERRLARALANAWKEAADDALLSAMETLLAAKVTKKTLVKFLAELGYKLKDPLTREQVKILEGRIRTIYQAAKTIASKEAKHRVGFNVRDARAIRAIGRQQVFWVNNFYSEQLSTRIQAVTNEIMLEQGLSQKEAAKVLRRTIRQEFGIVRGGKTVFAPEVPARYAGNVDYYYSQLASIVSHQSRTFGKMTAFEEAGVITYQLVNPNDERTGTICRELHLQVFQVSDGIGQMNKILSAKSPEEVKQVSPWLSGSELSELLEGTERGGKDAMDRLLAAGEVIPPFHPHCRTEPVILSAS